MAVMLDVILIYYAVAIKIDYIPEIKNYTVTKPSNR